MGSVGTKVPVNREYKDSLFRMVYREKEELLLLYNAVNQTAYENADELEIVTLENAIYMSMKNDLAFIVDMQLHLYEHQSTYNPNMPLRDLFYVAREYEALVEKKYPKKKLYGKKLVKSPTPSFVVFYNGSEPRPEREEMCLSDAFEKKVENPSLELKVQMININIGNNAELMKTCKTLRDYSIFVDMVRTYAKAEPLQDAVERAVDECINKGVLAKFLTKYRAEAIAVSIFEYNEEEVLKQLQQDYKEEGLEEGIRIGRDLGREEGRAEGVLLNILSLVAKGRLTHEEGAEELACSIPELEKLIEEHGFKIPTCS